MDKEPFDTFQFIETSDANPSRSQLLVLQNDGTLLSVNRDIQYITQEPDVKVIGEHTCTVFDVSSQQFYVDVDSSSNLINPEQFAIPDSDGNIYANSFLIESEPTSEPMDTETVEPMKPEASQQIEIENINGTKQANNFTEVTLTDAQYHLLEQKGWILLESGDKIYVLDTLGLHDITNDKKLIQKLRNEHASNSSPKPEPSMQLENTQCLVGTVKNEESETNPVVEEDYLVDFATEKDNDYTNENLGKTALSRLESKDRMADELVEKIDTEMHQIDETVPTNDMSVVNEQYSCNSIKIKTKYTFADVPDKIYLGKTVNGKKLYAKVTKSKHKEILEKQNMEMFKQEIEEKGNFVDNNHFVNIIQDYIREQPAKIKINNVIAADTVLSQLIRMDYIKESVVGNHVIITKSVTLLSETGVEIVKRRPSVVLGEVKPPDETHGRGRFVHTPYLLHNLAKLGQDPKTITRPESDSNIVENVTRDVVEFVHVHVTETKMANKPSSQSINVCNRKLSLDVIRDARKRHPNPVYACGSCAAVFKSQDTLKHHLENHYCADTDDVLTIDDTDQTAAPGDSYYVLDTGKEKWYSCLLCEAKFLKLGNCQKHTQTHTRPRKTNSDGSEDMKAKEYKCKMCPSKYYHASSLSKHIVKMHIQVSSKNKQ